MFIIVHAALLLLGNYHDAVEAFTARINSISQNAHHGTCVIITGAHQKGLPVRAGHAIEVLGHNIRTIKSTISYIEIDGEDVEDVLAIFPDYDFLYYTKLQICFKPSAHSIAAGMVLATPGSQALPVLSPHRSFKAIVSLLSSANGGIRTPLTPGFHATFHFSFNPSLGGIMSVFHHPGSGEALLVALPGDTVEVKIELSTTTEIYVGESIAIRAEGRTIGSGKIVTLL